MGFAFLVDGHAVPLVALLALGTVVGAVAGCFGVGGGFLLTPLLTVVFDVPLPIAVGTGLCLTIGTTVPALLRHRAQGNGEPRFDLLMLAGSLLGVDAGARALVAVSAAAEIGVAGRQVPLLPIAVQGGYVLLLVGAAVAFLRGSAATVRRGPLARVPLPPYLELPRLGVAVSAPLVAYVGFALGFLSGFLGIGAGVALLPVLVYGFGFPVAQAAGTGMLVLATNAAVGTVLHALRGHVHLMMVIALLGSASVSAQVGALATRWIGPRVLRRGFVGVLVAAAGVVLSNLVGRIR